ncbi:hypothetical protein [Silvibacterium acidisoli]|uniref:hypothetical protein n=1 Tax=Acidobacteriaceae bacterium ZG23-2 TaxID=2883246 RepID=UPI00406C2FFF
MLHRLFEDFWFLTCIAGAGFLLVPALFCVWCLLVLGVMRIVLRAARPSDDCVPPPPGPNLQAEKKRFPCGTHRSQPSRSPDAQRFA